MTQIHKTLVATTTPARSTDSQLRWAAPLLHSSRQIARDVRRRWPRLGASRMPDRADESEALSLGRWEERLWRLGSTHDGGGRPRSTRAGVGTVMSTHASILVDSVGPPRAEVCKTAASFP